MTSFLIPAAIALFGALTLAGAHAAEPVGVRSMAVPAPERGTAIAVTLWYPAKPGGEPELVGDNGVFQGTPAQRDAPIADGAFPVILLSHGGLRSAPGLDGWMAAELAANGFIVAAPHRPGAGLAAADGPRELWLRPADLSAALTALEREPDLAGRVDFGRVGVVGFQLGGTAALALAGGRLDAQAYAQSCDAGGPGPDCGWFARGGVDLRQVDTAKVGRSNLDPRVKAVVAIDPEHATAFSTESLSGIAIPVHIIDLGRPEAAGLEYALARGRYESVAGATPFDAFSLCKPAGGAILRSEGDDDTLCRDGDVPRAAIHARLSATILAAFAAQLRGGS